jgi:DNA polymerase III epsilon subunit-like protein
MVLNSIDKIIKLSEGITISKESENIHKISNEMSKTKGVDIKKELQEFNNMLIESDLVVAHNISFDKQMIMVECIRHKLQQNFTRNTNRKPEYCTMKNSVNICKIPKVSLNGDIYYKYPKLIELYQHLFHETPDGLHNSMIDVLACLRCYGKMKLDVDLLEKSSSLRCLNDLYL